MMSTRSPASSLVTAVTREPRMPMQVPCGSSRGSFDLTAILARMPGSRARPDFDQPLLDLGHLELEQPHQEFGRDPRQDELRALAVRSTLVT
jgi:hypothetical protein